MVCLLCADVDDFSEWSAGGAWALLVVGQPLMVKPVHVVFTSSPDCLYSLLTRALVRTQQGSLYCVKILRFAFLLHMKMNFDFLKKNK